MGIFMSVRDKNDKPFVPVWFWNIFTFHCSHLRKCYLWGVPFLGGVSEGRQLEAHMGIIRNSLENLLYCLVYLPGRLLTAHANSSFAQSLSFYYLPHVLEGPWASKFTTEAFWHSYNGKRKNNTTSLVSFKDIKNYRIIHSYIQEKNLYLFYTSDMR